MISVQLSVHIVDLTSMTLFMIWMIQWYRDSISYNKQTFTNTVKGEPLKQNIILDPNMKRI